MYQKGGLDPLLKVPNFKYTFNEGRKLFIGSIYPYAEYFLDSITNIPFNSYSYNGSCEYTDKNSASGFKPSSSSTKSENEEEFKEFKEITASCTSDGYPVYFLSGGSAYEILNKKFKNINLYDYCDATGDIDVTLYPPRLISDNYEGLIYFLNKNKTINSFYENFTSWAFDNFLQNITSFANILGNISSSIVSFDINEYIDIPAKNKIPQLGYKVQAVGNLYVVGFLNEDTTMFKIQVVCKIQDSTTSVIDHAVEIIIPLPESDVGFSPSDDSYSNHKNHNTIDLPYKKINIQKYDSLIFDNIDAYMKRKNVYGESNESEFIHKAINHIARIFYLYELIYRNEESFNLSKISLLFLFGLRRSDIKAIEFLHYYKMVDGQFHQILVDTKFFLTSYLKLIKKETYVYGFFIRDNPEYFNEHVDLEYMHDLFITELFNDNLFGETKLLTFPPALAGGKKHKSKKHKSKKHKSKIHKSKKIKSKKNKTKKPKRKLQ